MKDKMFELELSITRFTATVVNDFFVTCKYFVLILILLPPSTTTSVTIDTRKHGSKVNI